MRITIALLLAALALTGCAVPAEEPAAAPVTVTETAPAPSDPSTTPKQASSTPSEPAGQKVTVPGVVGENHQAAQNEMQAAGLFMLAEEDATGQARMLIMDRNWVVVRQSPKAGTKVTAETTITLYSKKIGE